jgi:hypothetical protein
MLQLYCTDEIQAIVLKAKNVLEEIIFKKNELEFFKGMYNWRSL